MEEKPNPRPKIDYPAFETKEWIPPDQRPKKKRKPRYVKPEGITQKLLVSSLVKIWNKFRVYSDRQVLLGSFAETHKRFRIRSNGYQTPCNCVVAIVYSHFIPMQKWDYYTIDNILYMGNDLYMSTIHHQSNRSKTELLLCEVYPSFYYGDTKVTITLKGNKHCGKLFEDIDTCAYLANTITKFFEEHASGVLTINKRHLSLWTTGNTYYMFDPTEHDTKAHPWRGLRGHGYACALRFQDTNDLVGVVHEYFGTKENLKFVITPCSIIRLVKLVMQLPVMKEHCPMQYPEFVPEKLPHVPSRESIEEPPEEKEIEAVSPDEEFADDELPATELDANDEFAPEVEPIDRNVISNSKIPVQKPRAESVTYFASVLHDKMGILRASTHQCDTRYTLQKGKQSVANAIMALTMLRLNKSREWFRKILDDVLKFGERYYGETIKKLPRGTPLKVSNVANKITLYNYEFTPIVDEYTTIGVLQSTKSDVLDLLPALQEFFRNSQTCVITGPLIVSTWFEDGLFYMFDPNERDVKGHVVVKSIQIGSEIQVLDYTPGVACVTWFTDLKLLVDLYMINIEPALRREPFILSQIHIKDYEYKPDDWYNFVGVNHTKWILRGTFNQNDRRFDKDVRNTQCTAAAAIALAMAFLKPIKKWKTSDVDEILIISEDYYKATVQSLKSRNLYYDPRLLVDELLRKFNVEGNEITFDIRDCIVNGLIEGSDEMPIFDLAQGIRHFFSENDYGILSCREIAVSIWQCDQVYYYYDSHSRDEDGVLNNYGTACVLRLLTVEDLARTLEANFEPGTNNMFNISSLRFIVWQKEEGGIMKPPLYNYKEVNAYTSILRTISSVKSARFKLNSGKQTIPMCLVAAAMMKIYPASVWTVDIMEEILTVGDKLFTDTMIDRERQDNLPAENDIDEVYAENCLMEFSIGVNRFRIEYKAPLIGNFEEHFKSKMEEFYSTPANRFNDDKELFITSNFYNVMTWFDGDVYYLFDPKPRDECGQVYGKEEWSAKIEPEPEAEGECADFDLEHLKEAVMEKLGGSDGEGDGSFSKESIEEAVVAVKHSPSYWRSQEENGLACVMWFVTSDKLIEHVYENTPPNRRQDLEFNLYPVNVVNKPELKKCHDPSSTREDNYAGDWYDFKEIDYGRWILRASFYNKHIMFPEHNRGKQQLAMCFAAIGYVKRFAVSRFNTTTINDILKYGDRLYSATRKIRMDGLRNNKNLGLSGAEIEEILNQQQYGVRELIRAFCIGLDQIQIQVVENVYTGDVNAKATSDILNVPRGVSEFFGSYKYGILQCKNLAVALWRGVNVFYMFDSNSNGPCGHACPSGEACVTRYLNTDVLSDVFVKNLVKEGISGFSIHLVKVRIVPCPRLLKPEEKELPAEPPKYTGITGVMPGKCILRGTLNQEHDTFGRGRNAQSATIAIIALSMSLIHKPYTWTVPIIDDILYLGDELYGATLDKLGYEYNPWEQGLPVSLVNKDYRVGSLRANFEVRPSDQRGVIDIKHPKILNLRQGIEKFFEENSYGVIETETLTVAVWEEKEQPGFIYMYDPNPRGPAGLYMDDGTACLLIFETSKLAAEHFLSNVTDRVKRSGEFVITPVEIVVGNVATKNKKKKNICCKADEVDMNKREPTTPCDKKQLRKMAERERKKKEAMRLAKIGRNDYFVMSGGDAILRGTRSQSSKHYSEHSRGYQDIPNCFAAFVVHRLSPVGTWHFKHIDMILDVGDQLYKDSYVTYSPKNRKLGMANVLRKVYIKEVQVSLEVYKPVMSNVLNAYNLELALINYFQQEQFAILSSMKEHVALFFKEGYYYLFDPHDRNVQGNKCEEEGVACVIKFETITNLVAKYMGNLPTPLEPGTGFHITLVTVGSIVKKGEKTPCCLPKLK